MEVAEGRGNITEYVHAVGHVKEAVLIGLPQCGVQQLSDDHGSSLVIQHSCYEPHKVGVAHLGHCTDLTVHSLDCVLGDDGLMHTLDSHLLTPELTLNNIPPCPSS